MSPSRIRLFFKLRTIRLLMIPVVILANSWLAWSGYNGYQQHSDRANIERLNQMVSVYKKEVGSLPDLNLIDLYHKGLTQQRLHRTPFGGYYRLDPTQSVVYNPNIASR